jgi:hypothetical protein
MSARYLSRAFMRISFLISLIVFVVFGGTMLIDQWIAGNASAIFILGTALLSAGVCLGLFAILAGIGTAISIAFSGEPPAGEEL